MAQYLGRMQGNSLEISYVTVQIEDGRFRIMAGRRPIGSWPLEKIHAERISIYKFDLNIDGEIFEYFPEDPSGFSDEIGAVVDLTNTSGRFGLKRRIAEASGT